MIVALAAGILLLAIRYFNVHWQWEENCEI
jgi:hypothetical protein